MKPDLVRVRYYLRRLFSAKPNPIRPWDEEPAFCSLMRQLDGRTLVDRRRCFMLYQLASQVARLPGDAAEVGVYKGGTARLLAEVYASTAKSLHLFDTFSGMPPTDPSRDIHREGDFGDARLEDVRAYLADSSRVYLHPGRFPETAKPIESGSFCFVHVDVDIYESVRDCCRFFYPRVPPGGVMVFDDYGFLSCPGAKLAVDEFFSDKPERPCYLPTGQCVVWRS